MKQRIIILCGILCMLLTGCKSDPTQIKDTPEDLKRVMNVMYHAASTEDEAYLASLARNLIIPDPEAWFSAVFPKDTAPALIEDYSTISTEEIVGVFETIAEKSQSEINVIRISDEEAGTDLQQLARDTMVQPATIYSVLFVKPEETRGMHLWSFAYIDGAFRLIGKLEALLESPGAQTQQSTD